SRAFFTPVAIQRPLSQNPLFIVLSFGIQSTTRQLKIRLLLPTHYSVLTTPPDKVYVYKRHLSINFNSSSRIHKTIPKPNNWAAPCARERWKHLNINRRAIRIKRFV